MFSASVEDDRSIYLIQSGLFRGICVDNRDPTGVGRIRVQVPQVLGAFASGWAFPAWSFHDLTIWPEDRLPKPGDGVWVMFESTSPDKMIWVASFGPLDLINQPGFVTPADYTSTITISAPPSPEWNQSYVFSGTLGSDGGVPNPNPKVYLQALPAGESDWQQVAGPATPDPITGDFSFTYTITIPGQVAYRTYFPGIGVYSEATSLPSNADTSIPTSITEVGLPTLYHGSSVSTSGTVNADSGERVTTGTVQLWWRSTVGPDQNWYQAGSDVAVVDGTFTLTTPALDVLGPTEWKIEYLGGNQFQDSTSPAETATVGLRPNSALAKQGLSHSAVAFGWTAISGATDYEVERKINNGSFSLWANGAFTGVNNPGLAEKTSYYYRVRPHATDPAGTDVYGSWSPVLGAYTGQEEIRDTGSSGNIDIDSNTMRSWRDDDANQPPGWQGYTRQGRPDDGKTANYFGVVGFGNNQIRDAVRAALGGGTTGTNRQQYGTCTFAEIQMFKRGDPWTGRVTINFYVTDSGTGTIGTTNGGKPSVRGTQVSRQSSASDSTKWYAFGTSNGQRLGDGTDRSVLIKNNGVSNYAAFSGTATVRLRWSWNYASTPYVAPKWL